MLESKRVPLDMAETRVLRDFLATLKLPSEQKIETLVIFPNIQDAQVQAGCLERGDGEPVWAGKELPGLDLGKTWFRFLPPVKLED